MVALALACGIPTAFADVAFNRESAPDKNTVLLLHLNEAGGDPKAVYGPSVTVPKTGDNDGADRLFHDGHVKWPKREEVVRLIVRRGPEIIRKMSGAGVQFTRQSNGELHLGRDVVVPDLAGLPGYEELKALGSGK